MVTVITTNIHKYYPTKVKKPLKRSRTSTAEYILLFTIKHLFMMKKSFNIPTYLYLCKLYIDHKHEKQYFRKESCALCKEAFPNDTVQNKTKFNALSPSLKRLALRVIENITAVALS
jgi:hypothetical protein